MGKNIKQEPKEEGKKPVSGEEFVRLAHNYYTSLGITSNYQKIAEDFQFSQYLAEHIGDIEKKYKVAFVWICLNQPYWQYAMQMMEGAKQFFLPSHHTDYFVWSDMPQEMIPGVTVFETEPVQWPFPTLMRYHLFLQQEEKLREYDYIFYCDVDMKFVQVVGDEILGEGLTAAHHPMYEVRDSVKFPLEPNPNSSAYIPQPAHYYAGGFQGGKADLFIEAMRVMKKRIDKDFNINYTARWNDESHWNKYLFENPPSVILDSSYVYPDSLIEEYYKPIVWGKNLQPRLITLTKPFSTSKEGGEAVRKLINPQ